MIKKKTKFKVDLIITGDWGLRDDTPVCRTDNYWEAQWSKVDQITQLQKKYNCRVINSGDIFDKWKTSPELLNECIIRFPLQMETIIGNHDMPSHQINLMYKSGLQTLTETGIVNQIPLQGDWGYDEDELGIYRFENRKSRKLMILHVMVYKGKEPYPGCPDLKCHQLMKKFPNIDLIITGHNHQTFTFRKGNQLLVNPGSLTREDADQIDHKPCVFLYDAEQHKVKPHYLKIKKNVISREHIEVKKSKEKRINAFIEKLKQNWDITVSFDENLDRAFKKNKINKEIQQLINKWMGV